MKKLLNGVKRRLMLRRAAFEAESTSFHKLRTSARRKRIIRYVRLNLVIFMPKFLLFHRTGRRFSRRDPDRVQPIWDALRSLEW